MTQDRFKTKCVKCEMPLAEGPLLTHPMGLLCEHCFEEVTPRCNFCNDADPPWVYDSDLVTVEAAIISETDLHDLGSMAMGEVWFVCDTCCLYLETDRIGALVERVIKSRPTPPGDMETLDAVLEMLPEYFKVLSEALIHPPHRREQ